MAETPLQRLDALAAQAMAKPRETLQALIELAPAGLPDEDLRRARVWGLARVYGGEAEGLVELLQAQRQAEQRTDLPARLRFDLLRTLSIAHVQMGLLNEALDWANRALEAARASGDAGAEAEGLLSCGVALSRSGQPERGIALYEQAHALFMAQGLPRLALSALNNMGINLKNLGRPDQALARYEQALALAEQTGLQELAAVLRTNLAEPLAQLGRLAEARRVGEASAAEMARQAHRPGELSAQLALGGILQESGEPEAAHQALMRALDLARQLGDRIQGRRAHQMLGQLHRAAGRYREALEHVEAAHEAERQQFNEESERRLRTLQLQTEVLAAQSDAQQARLRSLELERAQAELQSLNERLLAADREKSRLLACLAEESRTDVLTGLPNRRRLNERLAEEWQRPRSALCLAVLDVDHFKQINDRWGHGLGDRVLQQLGQLLAQQASMFAARLGGEEFCLLWVDAEPAAARPACEALRQAVAALPWAALHAELAAVTVSIGFAERAEAPADPQALLTLADERLYAAKRGGRNRVV